VNGYSKEVMMNAIKTKKVISLVILFLLPIAFLFSQSEDAQKLLESKIEGVVTLMAIGGDNTIVGEGTGFVVERGVIATCYQLVSKAVNVTGKNSKGKEVKIEGILAVDKNSNIVLLSVKGKAPAFTLGSPEELESGKKVFAIGSNESEEIVVSEGEVKEVFDLAADQKVVQTSLDVPRYFNGAPLLGENGQVLGMVIFFDRRVRITVPSNLLNTIQKQTLTKWKDWQSEDYLETPEGALFAGKVASLLDEPGSAQLFLEKARETRPNDIEIHSLLASAYNTMRNFEMAISSYNKVIELDNTRDDAYYGLGMTYIKMRRYNDALPLLEKAVELNPGYMDAYFYIGNAHQDLKNFDKAADAYEKFLESQPENAWETYYKLGVCRIELEQYDNAIGAFQEAFKEKPQDQRIIYDLAQAHEKAKQYDKAEELYMKISELTPEDPVRAYRAILMMYDKAKMNDKAIEIAKKISEMDSNNYESFYNLGFMYQNAKRYNEAVEAFKKAIELNPGYEYSYSGIGYIYYQQKRYSQSIEYFKKLVGIIPDHSDGWYFIGINYMQLKDFNSALEPFKKCVELRPDHGYALFNLGVTYLNLHDNISARNIHKKLQAVDAGLAKKLEQHLR
jgi:tetratricopeptide (TPR) repeat protein